MNSNSPLEKGNNLKSPTIENQSSTSSLLINRPRLNSPSYVMGCDGGAAMYQSENIHLRSPVYEDEEDLAEGKTLNHRQSDLSEKIKNAEKKLMLS